MESLNSSPYSSPSEALKSPEDALHETVNMIVSGYLKNNLDTKNQPTASHFKKGLEESIRSGIQLKNPNSRDAKVIAFLTYITEDRAQSHSHIQDELGGREPKSESSLRTLTHEIAEDFTIDISDTKKLQQLAALVYQSEIDILIKRGQGGDLQAQGISSWDSLDKVQQEKYYQNVRQKRNEQVRSIERWIKYVSSDEVVFPRWYKYFVITSLRSMGVEQFELGTYTYGGRDQKTLFRFPTLNPAVLAKVFDRMLAAYTEENRKKPVPTKYEIQDAARSGINEAEKLFLEKYAKEANFTQLYAYELSKYKEATIESRRSHEGVWIKYDQQEEGTGALKREAKKLSDSLQDKGTEWCTEGTGFSESQLAGGDFYVYYTREDFDKESYNTPLEDLDEEEKRKVSTMPRIAIKMYNGTINELRGIVGGNEQDLEPEMIDIARAKCDEESLGGREAYEKKARDMKQLLSLVQKEEKGTAFTREDLLFLYEVDGIIEGFGHNEDPRIEELLSNRNRKSDILTLCDCPPSQIAHDFTDINEQTLVYFEDDGQKLTFFDYRKEGNQAKLPAHIDLAKKIKETGSPARPDMSFEGGIVNIKFDRNKVKDRETAFKSFKEADPTPPYIWEGFNDMKFTTPEGNSFEIVVLSYNQDPTTRKSSKKIVEDMVKLGLRPPTFEEMVIAGIVHPDFTKTPNKCFVGLTSYSLDGDACVPYLGGSGEDRELDGDGWDVGWSSSNRFLCVRK